MINFWGILRKYKSKPQPEYLAKKPFPSDKRMKQLMSETLMRDNPMYQEDCAFTWLANELEELGITHDQFRDWVKRSQT